MNRAHPSIYTLRFELTCLLLRPFGCLSWKVGAIGYIDAGHGHSKGLGEVKLKNLDGLYLSTKEANLAATASAALSATPSVIPADSSADFSSVNLYDQPGPTTFPITMITYFYVQKDVTYMDPMTASLLKYFLKYFATNQVGDEGQKTLLPENLFTGLPDTVLTYNADTIDNGITWPTGTIDFKTETSDSTISPDNGEGGMEDIYFSAKRRTQGDVERSANAASIKSLEAKDTTTSARESPFCTKSMCWSNDTLAIVGLCALILAALGFILGLAALVTAMGNRTSKPRSAEVIPPRDIDVPDGAKRPAV